MVACATGAGAGCGVNAGAGCVGCAAVCITGCLIDIGATGCFGGDTGAGGV